MEVDALARRAVLAQLLLGLGGFAWAVESDPLPVPKGSPHEAAVGVYNEGTRLLLQRDFSGAQGKFEEALRLREDFAEAHNNLAFSLRMQSGANFERSLRHYNRAIALNPSLAQAYMYRGMLFVQLGDLANARADHARLLAMDKGLADRLSEAMKTRSGTDDKGGIASQYE